MKELVAVDPQTGTTARCGAIAQKRVIGKTTAWLTYDEPNRMWWIVLKDDCLQKIGFIEARREVCWETFEDLNEAAIAALKRN